MFSRVKVEIVIRGKVSVELTRGHHAEMVHDI
jgi:hypothetical protein